MELLIMTTMMLKILTDLTMAIASLLNLIVIAIDLIYHSGTS